MRAISAGAALAVFTVALPAQEPEPPQEPGAQALAELYAKFAESGIELDPERQVVRMKARVGRPDQPLEFLLVDRRGKGHEAMFVCEAKGSTLNAALLALGLERGENARIVEKDPPPTLEEIEAGAPVFEVFPPKGKPLWITVSWLDGEERVEHTVSDLLIDMETMFPVMGQQWIYLGGTIAPLYRGEPPVFVADYEGNFVSTIYRTPANHLITMKHERAGDEQNWWIAKIVPEPGTEVTLTFHRSQPPIDAEREKRIGAEWEAEQKRRSELDGERRDKDGGDQKDGGGTGR